MNKLAISLLLALTVMTTAQFALGQDEIEAGVNEGLLDPYLACALNLTPDTGTVKPVGARECGIDSTISDDGGIRLKFDLLETGLKTCSGDPICETFRLAKVTF